MSKISNSTNDDSLAQGQRALDTDGATHGGFNKDTNAYYGGKSRAQPGSKAPSGSYLGKYVDGAPDSEFTLNSKWSPLDDNRLVQDKNQDTGKQAQPKFTDYAGGKSARGYNKAAMQFLDADEAPAAKGSRQADWRGDK
jgi:hypothetical protein